MSEYKGDIKDPILTMLLDTLDAYLKDVQNQALLSTYAQRSDQVSDGLFEVLRRHLFGQMFPGPAYTVAQASLREVSSAPPVFLQDHHYFNLQDQEGNKVLFAPQRPTWIVPSHTNDVRVESSGDDLSLGFSIIVGNLPAEADGFASVFTGEVDPLLCERLRCRLPHRIVNAHAVGEQNIVRNGYPGVYGVAADFFKTPFESRFLHIPFDLLQNAGQRTRAEGVVWLQFPGLAPYVQELNQKLTLNAFPMWNFIRQEMLAVQIDGFRYRLPIASHAAQETIIYSAEDVGVDPPVEYVDAATVADPGYPYQYTTSANIRRDDIILSVSPPPAGDLKLRYYQYDLGESCLNIAAGRSFGLYEGIDERIKSVQSLVPTQRIDVVNDKEKVWEYFRSLLASRNRWLTRDDLRAAVGTFPPFSSRRKLVAKEKIRFQENVGRAPEGFLTPFTDILIPIRERELLTEPDKTHFEHELVNYLKSRSVSGNFVRTRLISEDDV